MAPEGWLAQPGWGLEDWVGIGSGAADGGGYQGMVPKKGTAALQLKNQMPMLT